MLSKSSFAKRGATVGVLIGIGVSAVLLWEIAHSKDAEGLLYLVVLLGFPANVVAGIILSLLALLKLLPPEAMAILSQYVVLFLGIPCTLGGLGALVGVLGYGMKERMASRLGR